MDCASHTQPNDQIRFEALRQLQLVADGDDDARLPSLDSLAVAALALLDDEDSLSANGECIGTD